MSICKRNLFLFLSDFATIEERNNMKYKKQLTIGSVVCCLVAFLYSINLFENKTTLAMSFAMIAIATILTYIIFKVETHIEKNHNENKINYDNIDFARYGFSIVIIIMHLRPFLGNMDRLDLVFNNILSRICVPLFFVITGYFVAKKEKDNPHYIEKYVKSMLPLYLVWSLIYVPLAISWALPYFAQFHNFLLTTSIPMFVYPLIYILAFFIILFIALAYIGVYYHLWYFPALFLSLYVIKFLRNKINIQLLLSLSFLFLLFGATETYYGIIPDNIQEFIDVYYSIFFTTRNFLFFGLYYVVLGYYLGQKQSIYTSYCFLKLIVCLFLLVFETLFLQSITRLDSNILLSCVPLIYYLFISLMYMNTIISYKKQKFRSLYKYYYLLHPWIIAIVQFSILFFIKEPIVDANFLWVELAIVLALTHIVSEIIIKAKQKNHLRYL